MHTTLMCVLAYCLERSIDADFAAHKLLSKLGTYVRTCSKKKVNSEFDLQRTVTISMEHGKW